MYNYKAVVINVVDGDTIDAEVSLGFDVHMKMRLRLSGINTPERGQVGYKEAKQFVIDWVAKNPIVNITTEKDRQEKYGRYLAFIYPFGSENVDESLNKSLLDLNLAVVYNGAKKE